MECIEEENDDDDDEALEEDEEEEGLEKEPSGGQSGGPFDPEVAGAEMREAGVGAEEHDGSKWYEIEKYDGGMEIKNKGG